MKRLLIRPGAIGDFLVSLPAVNHLKTHDTELWVREAVLPLAKMIAPARSIAATGLDLLGLHGVEPPAELIRRLAQFDEIHSWYGSNRAEFRDAVRHLPFQFYPALPPEDGPLHAVDFYAEQVGLPHSLIPRLPIESSTRQGALVHPFASGPRKEWPLADFRAVAQELQAEWCAGPEPGALLHANLDDLARRIARASVYIGNDSGIAHLAAAVGTTVVVLFGPTNPAVWAPRGPAVTVLSPMANIAPEDVIRAVRRYAASTTIES